MLGIDRNTVASLDVAKALERIRYDVRSDFIFAPHYSSIFTHAGDELWDRLKAEVESGRFEPSLPHRIEVPKQSRLSRPGAILAPEDRLLYQLLVDGIAPTAELQLDRARVFSHVLQDDTAKMFEDSHAGYARMKETLRALGSSGEWEIAIRTDVASFYERIYQHSLVNLLNASGCEGTMVAALERLLNAWTEKDSHGLLQGMAPSDFLGNFYLCGLDADLKLREIPSARYVDDIYVFRHSYNEALVTLMDLTRYLRDEGLLLNEGKTDILPAAKLVAEETELDKMFKDAHDEVVAMDEVDGWAFYGFQTIYEDPASGEEIEQDLTDEEIRTRQMELMATMSLYGKREDVSKKQVENIDKFCLPIFASARIGDAAADAIDGITARPHMSNIYASYLSRLTAHDDALVEVFQDRISLAALPYDWQTMWTLATLLSAQHAPVGWVDEALRILRDGRRAEGLRAICTLFAAKFGNASQRRLLKQHYSDETSSYVQAAILFSSRYFPKSERDTCVSAWGGHSLTNSLIAKVVKILN